MDDKHHIEKGHGSHGEEQHGVCGVISIFRPFTLFHCFQDSI